MDFSLGDFQYDQLLVVWNVIPVPITGRFPDLQIITQHITFPISQWLVFWTKYAALPAYSDEIVQDLHLFPFYPLWVDSNRL